MLVRYQSVRRFFCTQYYSPIQRSRQDAKILAEHLMELMEFISYDKSIIQEDFFTGLAKRAILETIPSAGYSCKLSLL